MNFRIGSKILYRIKPYRITIFEGDIRDISPSGKYVKIDDRWYESDRIEVLEVLT